MEMVQKQQFISTPQGPGTNDGSWMGLQYLINLYQRMTV